MQTQHSYTHSQYKDIGTFTSPLLLLLLICPLGYTADNNSITSSLVLNSENYYHIDKQTIINGNCLCDTLAIDAPMNATDDKSRYVDMLNEGTLSHSQDDSSATLIFSTAGRLHNKGRIQGWEWNVIFDNGEHSLINEGQILAHQGTALLLLDQYANIVNSGEISGGGAAIAAFGSNTVDIINDGIIRGVEEAAIILPSHSSVTNSAAISSQQSAAILLSGENNIVTLDSGSQLSGHDNLALLSQAAGNSLVLKGKNREDGNFLADHPENGLKKMISTANSDWILGGKMALWGAEPSVLDISGALELKGSVTIGGGGGTTINESGRLKVASDSSLTGSLINHGQFQLAGHRFTQHGDLMNSGEISTRSDQQHDQHILTIDGNFYGAKGSRLTVNASLGDDSSKVDRLIVKGDALGSTVVEVHNVGGTGGQTQQGIELIHVNGRSDAKAFVQNKRIVAGSYDYFIQQSPVDNHWYLNSTLSPVAPSKTPQREAHEIVQKPALLRPEAGAYAVSNSISNRLFITSLNDRQPTATDSTLWLRQTAARQASHAAGQLSDHGNQYVTQLGGELATFEANPGGALHLGTLFGYGTSRGHTGSTVTGFTAQRSLQGYSGGLSATWFADERQRLGVYSDNWLLYSRFSHHIKGDDLAAETWHARGYTLSTEWGYVAKLGLMENSALQLQPQFQMVWLGVGAGDRHEASGSEVVTQNHSLTTRLGLRITLDAASTSNLIKPYIELNGWHNDNREGVSIEGKTTTLSGMKNITEIKTGIDVALTPNLNVSLVVNRQQGGNDYRNTGAMLSARLRF